MNSTKYSIIHTLGKFGQRNERISVNMVNVMNKFSQCNEQKVWKIGYCNEQICGKIWWILTEIWRIYLKEYNKMRNISVIRERV